MGLTLCIEERDNNCSVKNKIDFSFGNKNKNVDKDTNIIENTFTSCVVYRKNNEISTKKKIKKLEKRISKLKNELRIGFK